MMFSRFLRLLVFAESSQVTAEPDDRRRQSSQPQKYGRRKTDMVRTTASSSLGGEPLRRRRSDVVGHMEGRSVASPDVSDDDGHVIRTLEELSEIVESAGSLLTKPHAALYRADIVGNIAFFESGLLLIAETAQSERAVNNFIDLLNHRALAFRRIIVDDDVMASALIKLGGMPKSVRTTRRQHATTQENRILSWIHLAADEGISDIHISTIDAKRSMVEMRVDSVLYESEILSTEAAKALMGVAYGMCEEKSDPVYSPVSRHNGNMTPNSANLPANVIGLRLQWSPLADNGRYLVMRILYRSMFEHQTLSGLGFLRRQILLLTRLRNTPYGMIILCGPVGSGKSTTTALQLDTICREARSGQSSINVVTIEDPVEYRIDGAKQQMITNKKEGAGRGEQMHEAIRSLLRQDVNVALIGETRDKESAILGLNATRSGMQVWTTLHTNFADKVPARLRNLGLPVDDIYDETAYTGYVCQRLVRKLCPHCRVPLKNAIRDGLIRPDLVERLNDALPFDGLNIHVAYQAPDPGGKKCPHCSGRGYKGRSVIAEIIVTDAEFMAQLAGAPVSTKARRFWILERGGVTLMAHGLVKVACGETSPMEMERVMGWLNLDIPQEQFLSLLAEESDNCRGTGSNGLMRPTAALGVA